MLLKCFTHMSANLENCNGHKTGKGQFSFQSQRRAMPKNVQTTIQLCSFHLLVRFCSKSFKLGFSNIWTENFQIYKLDLEKVDEPEIKLPTSVWSSKKGREFQKNIYSCFIDYAKAFECVVTTNCGKFLKRQEYQTTLPVSWETCMQAKKQQLDLEMKQMTDPNLKPVHCSMSCSTCCFLTCIQVSQETGKMVWYFHLFKNFPQLVVIHKILL